MVLIKNMNCSQWPLQLPTLKIVRLITRGFSFSFYLASKLTSWSVSCLTSQILPTLYLTLFSLSHQLIPDMSLLCPQLMLSRHSLWFHSRLLCLQVDPCLCFLCQVLFQVRSPSLQERLATGQPFIFLLLAWASLSGSNSVLLSMYEAYRPYPNFHNWYGSESM